MLASSKNSACIAIARRDWVEAIRVAEKIAFVDPCDETAMKIELAASRGAGDPDSAREALRTHERRALEWD